ncbi:hypothetical protein PGT21_016272 [Puccinia graminis f. sp. tritici]|uniref:Bromo domain-containing protein n=1 Tax=Puccinia graminis f. sp. tritici TaxID=56615 RepID=A0A5B0QUV1_PUCGR|nr:hypothetical protein PGT21_016272 [Puccinia graminis f. sp. tritici]
MPVGLPNLASVRALHFMAQPFVLSCPVSSLSRTKSVGGSLCLTLQPRPPPQQPQLTASSSSPFSNGPTLDQINQIRSLGLQLWHQIINSTDADGRLRSIEFMDLPSAVDYPDYYQFIKHPIALNLIKSQLDYEHNPYLSFNKLLSDLKLVFSNAKKYNVG